MKNEKGEYLSAEGKVLPIEFQLMIARQEVYDLTAALQELASPLQKSICTKCGSTFDGGADDHS